MTKNTLPKHKTPNYKLVAFKWRNAPHEALKTGWRWEAMPLRAGRKDL